MNERTIRVDFVDDQTQAVIVTSNVPLTQLPETFAVATQLQLAGAHYVVASAEPAAKAEFAQTGRLTVRLREQQHIDPREILFSLPTICGAALPATVARAVTGDYAFMCDDDFRQTEFIDPKFAAEIEAELADIRRIHAEERVEPGFKKLHVRKRISEPLPRGLRWAEVVAVLRNFTPLPDLAMNDKAHVVEGALVVRLEEDAALWGLEEAGELKLLCLEDLFDASDDTIEQLKTLANSLRLAFVDWCSCRVYYPLSS